MDFNLQDYLRDEFQENRASNARLEALVQATLLQVNQHVTSDAKVHENLDGRMKHLEAVNRNLGRAFGVGFVGFVGLLFDAIRSHFFIARG